MIWLGLDNAIVDEGEHMWGGWGHMWGGWGVVWLMLLWVLVLGLIVWGVLSLTGSNRPDLRDTHPTPAQVLQMRFARGEISEEEYRQARAALEASPRAGA